MLRIVSDPIWLEEAICRTLGARGATTPGIDGMTRVHVENNIVELARTIGEELRTGTYEPQPVRRVHIRKANGKLRPLGIPTLKDRIVQRAMLMAMDPIWESDFHTLSYGFRPCRSVHQAIRTVKVQLQDNNRGSAARWIIEGGLTSYFDTIHHRLLMKAVRKRIFKDVARRMVFVRPISRSARMPQNGWVKTAPNEVMDIIRPICQSFRCRSRS